MMHGATMRICGCVRASDGGGVLLVVGGGVVAVMVAI